jgi:hypothetical protein
LGLFGVVVLLGLSNIGLVFAAAILAKDTKVDKTGVMTVKGEDTAVMIVSTGKKHVFIADKGNHGGTCVPVRELAEMFASTVSGTQTTAIIVTDNDEEEESDGLTRGLSYKADGTFYNNTHVCLSRDDGGWSCADFGDTCEQDDKEQQDGYEGRRLRHTRQ